MNSQRERGRVLERQKEKERPQDSERGKLREREEYSRDESLRMDLWDKDIAKERVREESKTEGERVGNACRENKREGNIETETQKESELREMIEWENGSQIDIDIFSGFDWYPYKGQSQDEIWTERDKRFHSSVQVSILFFCFILIITTQRQRYATAF